MNIRLVLLAGVWVAAIAPGGLAAQTRIDLSPAAAARAFASALPRAGGDSAPGCAVAIASDTGLVAARYYGLADLEQRVPIGPASVFHVASLTKQFTGFAVAILAAEGRLSLDDSIGAYVPGLAPRVSRLPLRLLLTHTSGIRDQWTLLSLAGWGDDEPRSQADILWLLRRQRDLNFPPGETWLYSNSGYTLLAEAVAAAADMPFGAFLQHRVFGPLAMSRTRVQTDHDEIVRGRVSGYEPADDSARPGERWRTSNPVFDTWGATGLLTTPEDLARWVANLLDPRVEPAAVRLVREFRGPAVGSSSRYGLGVVHWMQGGRPGFGHGGTDEGFWADLLVFTADRFGTIMLCNSSEAAPYDLNPALARAILGTAWRDPPALPQPARAPAPGSDSATPAPPLSAAERARIVGTYRSRELATDWTIRAAGDSLVVDRPRGRTDVLHPVARDELTLGPYRLKLRRVGVRVSGFDVSSGRVRSLGFDRVR